MPTIASSNIPSPKSWDEFEDITLSATKSRWNSPSFFRNGRQGQRQDGVDVFGTANDGASIGVQCKNTIGGLSVTLVEKEIKNAGSFEPPLNSLYIATTAPRDAVLQEAVRKISETRKKNSKFSVDVLFWDDIAHDLATDEKVFFKHYPQFSPKKSPVKEHDQKLYDALIQLLPSTGVIQFLDQNNMAGFSFLDSMLDPLRKFYYEWNRPEQEFINSELESLRKELWQRADQYLDVITTETFSVGSMAERRSVPEEWQYQQPERFNRVVKDLHSLAGEIVDLHGKLVRAARDYFVGKI